MRETIKSHIQNFGHHVYLVLGGTIPRYSYSIGLYECLGFELVLAGASFYSGGEVHRIVDELANTLKKNSQSIVGASFSVDSLGEFTLRRIDDSWSKELLIGALDYYGLETIDAFQIVPDLRNWTIDIPHLDCKWDALTEPTWRWMHEAWCYPVPEESIAVTSLGVLRGEVITEAARWEADQWELFSGAGSDVSPEEVRVIPLVH